MHIFYDELKMMNEFFMHSSKQRRHRRLKNLLQQSKHVHPLVLKPPGVCELLDKADGACSIICILKDTNLLIKSAEAY